LVLAINVPVQSVVSSAGLAARWIGSEGLFDHLVAGCSADTAA
jgi:hypothetical protein